jgi:hypothetical protein
MNPMWQPKNKDADGPNGMVLMSQNIKFIYAVYCLASKSLAGSENFCQFAQLCLSTQELCLSHPKDYETSDINCM